MSLFKGFSTVFALLIGVFCALNLIPPDARSIGSVVIKFRAEKLITSDREEGHDRRQYRADFNG